MKQVTAESSAGLTDAFRHVPGAEDRLAHRGSTESYLIPTVVLLSREAPASPCQRPAGH